MGLIVIWPNRFSRLYVLDRVRILAVRALWKQDDVTWNRAADILDREGRRIQRSYTAKRQELSHAE